MGIPQICEDQEVLEAEVEAVGVCLTLGVQTLLEGTVQQCVHALHTDGTCNSSSTKRDVRKCNQAYHTLQHVCTSPFLVSRQLLCLLGVHRSNLFFYTFSRIYKLLPM